MKISFNLQIRWINNFL